METTTKTCQRCNGLGEIDCGPCVGHGDFEEAGSGAIITCGDCDGEGWVACPDCDGEGEIDDE